MNSITEHGAWPLPAHTVLVARIIFAGLLLYVSVNSLVPSPDMPDSGLALTRWLAALIFGSADQSDKITHFLAYGALGFFAGASRFTAHGLIWLPGAALALYGLMIEGLQALGGSRTASWLDGLANLLGAVSGLAGFVLCLYLLGAFIRQRSVRK